MCNSSRILTYKRDGVARDGQQVVHDEQEDGVAQDEGHLEGGAVDALGGEQEAEEVDGDQEAAGDEEVHHVQSGSAPHHDLDRETQSNSTSWEPRGALTIGWKR